jgi:hypothetical protein
MFLAARLFFLFFVNNLDLYGIQGLISGVYLAGSAFVGRRCGGNHGWFGLQRGLMEEWR